jgi:hypothetical protein
VNAAADNHRQIVEIVSDAAGQNRSHLRIIRRYAIKRGKKSPTALLPRFVRARNAAQARIRRRAAAHSGLKFIATPLMQ